MAYTEDLVFGWAMSQAANTSAVRFHQGSFDNFDAARGMQARALPAPVVPAHCTAPLLRVPPVNSK